MGVLDWLRAEPAPQQRRVKPFTQAGSGGTVVMGGIPQSIEIRPELRGDIRHRTAADMLSNISIIAAGLRYFLDLVAQPNWSVEPAEDLGEGESSDAAKKAAEFFENVMYDMESSWIRVVRRAGFYRFHGFGIHEWTAKRREDGTIGLKDVAVRPPHTISRWHQDEFGQVLGVWQTNPNTAQEIYLPRGKIVYLVDDLFSDSPEGLGLFRQLVEPATRLERYLALEGIGYERDLRGTPIGRAPLSEIAKLLQDGVITEVEAKRLTKQMEDFISLQVRSVDTGMMLDSAPYRAESDTGETVSSVLQWGVELLQGQATSVEHLGAAVERLNREMARIIATEGLLVGSDSGSRALSEDKSRNLYLRVNSTTGDIAECFEKDLIDPIWALNGLPNNLKPTLRVADVSFRSVEQVSAALRDMATAGATLRPDDPVIDDVRDLLGVSRQPELTPDLLGLATGLPDEEELNREDEEEENLEDEE